MNMTSSRPYLRRAIYQWILDNDMTPYMLVNANIKNVQVPSEHVSNGKIILNISPNAVQSLDMGDSDIRFHARFDGVSQFVCVPVHAVMAVYAKENGRGMVFSKDAETLEMPGYLRNLNRVTVKKPPVLRLAK